MRLVSFSSLLGLSLMAFLTVSYCSFGQPIKQGSIWYPGGGHIGLDFRTSPPAVLTDGRIWSRKSRTSTITDENGNLLFYTNADTVWNRFHEVMPNGAHINSHLSFYPHAAVIVPHPGDGALYYVFSISQNDPSNDPTNNSQSGFTASIVDISKDGGKGAVIAKDDRLLTKSLSLLSVTSHADEKTFWIVTHGFNDNLFYAFHLSESGLSAPVISVIGDSFGYTSGGGQLKLSPDGTRLAVAAMGQASLYDFNSMTGAVTNFRTLGKLGAEGVEFSPNSDLLYFSAYGPSFGFSYDGVILQYDIERNDLAGILDSKTLVGYRWSTELTDLQLAYDGKIYVGIGSGVVVDSLMCLQSPNTVGSGAKFVGNFMFLPRQLQYLTRLPLSVQSYYRDAPVFKDVIACTGSEARLNLSSLGYADSVVWDFGNGEMQSFSGMSGKNVGYRYTAAGSYSIVARKYIGTIFREIGGTVTVIDPPHIPALTDTTICAGEHVVMDATSPGATSYTWSTGQKQPSIDVDGPGLFFVEVSNATCTSREQVQVQVKLFPEIDLGPDRVECNGNAVLAVDNHPAYAYLWSTGDTGMSTVVTNSGKYTLTVANGRCAVRDSVRVDFGGISGLEVVGAPFETLYGKPLRIEAIGNKIDEWIWDFGDGSATSTRQPSVTHEYREAGIYTANVTGKNELGCEASVEFEVVVPQHFFIPNVFTPNGDGYNDFFEVQYNGDRTITVDVFDRWGNTVFHSDDNLNPWDGSNHASGIYYYSCHIGSSTYKGWLQLER